MNSVRTDVNIDHIFSVLVSSVFGFPLDSNLLKCDRPQVILDVGKATSSKFGSSNYDSKWDRNCSVPLIVVQTCIIP